LYLGDCKFATSAHRHRPSCGVRGARGDISPSRERI